MNAHKVSELFIATGAGLDTDATAVSSATAQFNFLSADNTVVKGNSVTATTDPIIYAMNILANGDLKRSFPLRALNVTGFKANSYAPATRCVKAIGYNRKSATGSIEVNNSTQYLGSIVFNYDKLLYAQRQETLRINFTSAASASQSTIADQIVAAINATPFGTGATKVIKAVKVGDGTGVYGVTSATNFGVEIWGLDVEQFSATSYKETLVSFSVALNNASGFGATTNTSISNVDPGVGTYNSIYNLEKFNYQYEGVLNRTKFPVPTLAYLANSTGIQSASLSGITCTGTSGEDKLTVTTGNNLPAGSKIVISGNTYEIKYWVTSGTDVTAILTTVLLTSPSSTAIAGKAWYDVINIEVQDTVVSPGAAVNMSAKKVITIASPAIETSATDMTTASTTSSDIRTLLNAWMPHFSIAAL
jgi:hypothetical protein